MEQHLKVLFTAKMESFSSCLKMLIIRSAKEKKKCPR